MAIIIFCSVLNSLMRKEDMTPQQRMAVANRSMEDTSRDCARVLYETMDLADDTTQELYRQSEALDRTEAHLDTMDVDLEQSRRNMREVKSVWGSLVNKFTKPTFSKEPKSSNPSPPSQPRSDRSGRRGPSQAQAQAQAKSTGNEIVDRNLDEIERGLRMLEGQSLMMGHQLDESNVQIDRISKKMGKTNAHLKNVTGDINKELH